MKKLLALLLMVVTIWATETDMDDAKPKRRKVYRGDIETHNPHITTLDLSDDHKLKNIRFLEHFPNLVFLNLSYASLKSVKCLLSLKHLEMLKLDYCVYIEDLETLISLKNLKELSIVSVWNDDNDGDISKYHASIDFISNFKKLIKLDISHNNLISKIEKITHLLHLKKLNVAYTSIQDLHTLENLVSLEELQMNNVHISHIPTAFLHQLPQLKKVTFDKKTRYLPLPDHVKIVTLA